MKRVIRLMGMMALVALAFTSCKKTEQKSVFRAATQQFVVEDEDRAYVDPARKIHFELGDVCMMFNISTDNPLTSHCATYAAVEDGNTVEFQNCGLGTVAENILDAGYFAYYPGNVGGANHVVTELEDGENKSAFLIRPEQNYRADMVSLEDMYMAAKVDDVAHLADADFTFKNLCGILSLKPYEANPRAVTEIQIIDNVFHLTGWVEVIIPELDPEEMLAMFNNYDMSNPSYMAALAAYKDRIGYRVYDVKGNYYQQNNLPYNMIGDNVTLKIDAPVQLGTSKATTPAFNIVLRPLAFAQGGHIIFHFADGSVKDCEIGPSEYNKYIMKPNLMKSIGMNMDLY